MRVVLSLVAMSALAAAPDWSWVDPRAEFLVGVEFRQLLESPLGKGALAELKRSRAADALTLEVMDSIDHVLVYGSGGSPVLVVRGKLDLAKVKAMGAKAGLSLGKYMNFDTLVPSQRGMLDKLHIALVSDSLILIGDPLPLRAALRRGPAAPDVAGKPVFDRALVMAEQYELWAVGEPKSGRVRTPGKMDEIQREVSGISFGASLRQGLDMRIKVDMKDAGSMDRLARVLQGVAPVPLTSFMPGAAKVESVSTRPERNTIRVQGMGSETVELPYKALK
ncbi:MAG: hypothetical protein FJW40_11765 [Acidobacteria bacterium]|nr:hypothetical protein [Acidobacteriota bacterium]